MVWFLENSITSNVVYNAFLKFIRLFRFHTIYSGTGVSYKIAKLSENRSYKVRLFASNDAGQGPYSQLYEFKTAYAHPPPIKGSKSINQNKNRLNCVNNISAEYHFCL